MDLKSFKIKCDQIIEGDYTVIEAMRLALESDYTEEEGAEIFEMLTDVFNRMGKGSEVKYNCAYYLNYCSDEIKIVLEWLDTAVEKDNFPAQWAVAYPKLREKLKTMEVGDVIILKNMIQIVNEYLTAE